MRVLIASLFLMPLIFKRGEFHIVRRHWREFFWVGIFTTAIPFTLLSYVSLSMTAGYTSLLNATVPMFSAIIAWIWLKQTLTWVGIIGLVLGFAGVFVLASPGSADYGEILLPITAAVLATSGYAYGSCYSSLHLHKFPSITAAAGSQMYAAIFMLPFGLWFWPDHTPSALSWLCALALGVFSTAIALIMFYHLLKQVGVAKTVSVTYLIPAFGILWGILFLDESLTGNMLIGGALILAGVGVTTSASAKKGVRLS